MEFSYSSGDPLSYAEILVWSPGADKVEFQNGRTDKNGRFAFAPSENGTWRIDANDGRGHKKTAVFQIEPTPDGVTTVVLTNSGSGTTTLGAILGLSFIFNIVMAVILFRRKKY
ncbi:MAG: hypothetical protein JJV98_15485 [Desulfosarcina sp.]|nr:hypothetical protein [Desulfobacterales bacterium]